MRRTITEALIKWKENKSHKPLIIRGARQVGKTYTITEFGEKYFKRFVKIDFEKQITLRKIFSEDLQINRIIELIEIATNTPIVPGETLLFLDEIQVCPRALMALRYFYEDKTELHVIAAGSLLEFEIEKISFPVGRVEFWFMYPLTFEEFLMNTGEDRLLQERPFLFDSTPLPEFLHAKFLKKLKQYFFVGGMPEVTQQYVHTESFLEVKKAQEHLVLSFLQDIPKYENKINVENVHGMFEAISRRIGQPVKYTELARDLTHYKIKQMIHILERALLVHPVLSSAAHALPLGGDINKTTCKFCFLDIGLMQHLCGIASDEILNTEDLLNTYQGALCEQFIGQELIAVGGSQLGKLYYWSRAKRGSQAEVDYLLVQEGKIFPLEIKKGTSGRLRSLHLFLEEHPHCSKGFVLNSANLSEFGKLYFRPLYSKLHND